MSESVHPRITTASWRAYRPEMGAAVGASLGTPKWAFKHTFWPVWAITTRGHYLNASDEVFEQKYLAQLDRYGVGHMREKFAEIADASEQSTLVVLCFEANRDDCHRGMFARWWEERTGEVVDEQGDAGGAATVSPKAADQPEQEGLFDV